MIGRRGFITGLVSLVAAPAIVRAGSLMPVRVVIEPYGIGPNMTATEIIERFNELVSSRLDWTKNWHASYTYLAGDMVQVAGITRECMLVL